MTDRILFVFVLILLLAACSGAPVAPAPEVPVANAPMRAPTVPPSQLAAAPLAAIEVVAETDTSRTIKHALGETEIPRNAERILIADLLVLGAYAALGEVPYTLRLSVGKRSTPLTRS